MTDSRKAIEAANLANTTLGLDYDEQETLLRGEMSADAKLTRVIIQILGVVELTGLALLFVDKVSAGGLSNFANAETTNRNGIGSLQLNADELREMGFGTGSGSFEITSAPGGFAEGLGVDEVSDSGVVTFADNPSDQAIAWVLSGGRQGAIDANVVWLRAHSRGGDDHAERINVGTHLFGIKRFADGTLRVVASRMPNTGTDARYIPVPTGVNSTVVELPLVQSGNDWGIETTDGAFQALFVGQFDKTFKLPIDGDESTRLGAEIFANAVSDVSGTVTVGPAAIPSPDIHVSSPDLTPAQQAELDKITKLLDDAYTIDTYKEGDKIYATFTDAKTGETIPEIRIDANDPEQLSWSKVYEYRDHTIVTPQSMDKITVGADGEVSFDFPGYVWKDGKFEPLIVEGQPVKNPAEAQIDLMIDGDPTHTLLTIDEFRTADSYDRNNKGGFHQGNLIFPMAGLAWRDNILKILDIDGTTSDVTTSSYVVFNSKDTKYPYQVLYFMGKDKKIHSILVDSLDVGWENTKAWGEWGNFPED